MIRAGIIGAAGYTGGELIRLLVNHPETEIAFANSKSNAGNRIADVHEGLEGDLDLRFTGELPFEEADVLFLCLGHGKSAEFLTNNNIPEDMKIIDLAQDFRLEADGNDFVYGLPEINRERIKKAKHVANPGCFATCIQLGLLPAAKMGMITKDVSVNAITGSTGAGQKPTSTSHFSWRNDNISIYKAFGHQHLHEIRQSLRQVQGFLEASIDFIPYRGCFARGIFATEVVRTERPISEIVDGYKAFYSDAPFTHYSERAIDLKEVVGTNKCLIHCDLHEGKLLVTSVIDNLLKGAVGQAVENMNIMFGLDETMGLKLKATAF